MYVKGDSITHVDALSRLEFANEKVENHENAEEKILQRVKTDVLPLNRLRIEIKQDIILGKILERIKRNI